MTFKFTVVDGMGQYVIPAPAHRCGKRSRTRSIFCLDDGCYFAAIQAIWTDHPRGNWHYDPAHPANSGSTRVYYYGFEHDRYRITRVEE